MPKPDLTIKATGYQWYWGYEYPDQKIAEFVSNILPEDKAKAAGRALQAGGDRAAGGAGQQDRPRAGHRRRRDPRLRRSRPSASSPTPSPAGSTRPGSRPTASASTTATAASCAASTTPSCRSRCGRDPGRVRRLGRHQGRLEPRGAAPPPRPPPPPPPAGRRDRRGQPPPRRRRRRRRSPPPPPPRPPAPTGAGREISQDTAYDGSSRRSRSPRQTITTTSRGSSSAGSSPRTTRTSAPSTCCSPSWRAWWAARCPA